MASVRLAFESKQGNKKTSILATRHENIASNLLFYKAENSLSEINQMILQKKFTIDNTSPFLNAMLTTYHQIDKDQSVIPDWEAVIELATLPVSK